ncbi:hypothetical protein O6H91_01G068300 [Diphasiastrum complanatum]|nr:hypothetical protein O6H91_01G068300 [Diphasiastrum complanatum]
MTMNFSLLPWRPELIFTGTSVMKVNPETGKFRSHFDYWDSIENNDYFSFEGFMDVLRQLRIYKVPDLETPDYKVLKRTADYEVREYRPFIVVETEVKGIAGSKGFSEIAGYIFGKNERGEKIQMTTPVFNQKLDGSSSERIQIVIPKKYRLSDLPSPLSKGVNLQEKGGGFAGVLKFSGKLSEDIVVQKESILRAALQRDRLNPREGFMLARYNDPGRTPEFLQDSRLLPLRGTNYRSNNLFVNSSTLPAQNRPARAAHFRIDEISISLSSTNVLFLELHDTVLSVQYI